MIAEADVTSTSELAVSGASGFGLTLNRWIMVDSTFEEVLAVPVEVTLKNGLKGEGSLGGVHDEPSSGTGLPAPSLYGFTYCQQPPINPTTGLTFTSYDRGSSSLLFRFELKSAFPLLCT